MSEPLEALKSPMGTFEPNVLLAGMEAAAASWLAHALLSDPPSLVPTILTYRWHWSIAVWSLLALVGVVLAGLAVEGIAGAAERVLTWTSFNSHKLRPRFAALFAEPPARDWEAAQRWIWKSPEASSEFSRRRLRLLAARNTTFVLLLSTLCVTVGLALIEPSQTLCRLGIVLGGGLPGTCVFAWVWVAAQQDFNRAVLDAGKIGAPT